MILPANRKQKRVYVALADDLFAESLRSALTDHGFDCEQAAGGEALLRMARVSMPDFVILDRDQPDLSGEEVVCRLKRLSGGDRTFIIMLADAVNEVDELTGFFLGVDDYLVKPVHVKVLMARIRAIFRRISRQEQANDRLTVGPFELDAHRYLLKIDGQIRPLTRMEFSLLHHLMKDEGWVLSRDQLIESVWKAQDSIKARTVDVHIKTLRRKLGPAADWITTIHGVGYSFRRPNEQL